MQKFQTRFGLFVALFAAAAAVAIAAGDSDVAGNWRVEFIVPSGQVMVNMTIIQNGRTLTGRVINEYGEFPLKGTVDGDQVTVSWSEPEDGEQIEITMKGTVSGETIDGVARLGNIGEGSLSARRLSRNS